MLNRWEYYSIIKVTKARKSEEEDNEEDGNGKNKSGRKKSKRFPFGQGIRLNMLTSKCFEANK